MKTIKNIFVIIICIMLEYCFLRVGSPLQNNIQIINLLISFFTIIIIMINIGKKEKLRITKMEIFIFLLILTFFIPIIFNSQSSLNSTIDSIFKYISIFNIFIIVKYIINIDKKYIDYIVNTTITASIILIIFGIDMMNNNIFENVYNFLNKVDVKNGSDVRMDSLYEYPNSFAVFLGISLIFSIGQVLKLKDKTRKNIVLKFIYLLIICFQIYGIIMSGSRMTIIFLVFSMIIWLLLERKKFFNKRNIIIFSSITIITILFIILCYTIEPKLVLFNKTKEGQTKYTKEIYDFKPNTEYTFKFNISCYNKTSKTNQFRIIVRELNGDFVKTNEKILRLDNFEGTKKIKIKTKSDTKTIKVVFETEDSVENKTYFEVKDVLMNNKKLKMKYFIIPLKIADRMVDINDYSIKDRYQMIKDGFNLAKHNLFTGLGGDGWYYNYEDIKEYNHSATQMHCYLLDIFIQNGIFGLIVILLIYFIFLLKIIKAIKEKNSQIYPFILALIFVLSHSLFDFDMNFYSIIILTFILFSIIDNEVEGKDIVIKNGQFIRVISVIIVTIILSFNIRSYVAYKINKNYKDNEYKKENYIEMLRRAEIKNRLEPYNYDYIIDKIKISIAIKNDIALTDEEYSKYTKENIKLLSYILKEEKGRKSDLELIYYYLCLNYIDSINDDNIEIILDKLNDLVKEMKSYISDTVTLVYFFDDIEEKLDKHIDFENEKIAEKYYEIIDNF